MSGGYVFDYAKRQYMRGFAGTLYSTQSIVVHSSHSGLDPESSWSSMDPDLHRNDKNSL